MINLAPGSQTLSGLPRATCPSSLLQSQDSRRLAKQTNVQKLQSLFFRYVTVSTWSHLCIPSRALAAFKPRESVVSRKKSSPSSTTPALAIRCRRDAISPLLSSLDSLQFPTGFGFQPDAATFYKNSAQLPRTPIKWWRRFQYSTTTAVAARRPDPLCSSDIQQKSTGTSSSKLKCSS